MCKSYVAVYLQKNFGNPVRLPRKSNIRYAFLSCIQKQFENHYNNRVKILSNPVQVHLNEKDLRMHGSSVMPGMMYFVNKIFEEKIKNEMFFEINSYHFIDKMSISEAIRKYQQVHGYDEEVFPFETIHRAYYDMRKTTKINSNNAHKN